MLISEQSTSRFRAAHYAHLRHLALFALVVESGSFTIAARRLGIGKSSVSRQISELEDFIGARLLNRSTRALSLTDAGRLIEQDCLGLVEAATRAFDRLDGDLPLQGRLKIASTVEHGQYVLPPIVAEFVKANPMVDVELALGDTFLDLVDNGIDLAIRVGTPGPSPQNITQKIAELEYQLYGHEDILAGPDTILTPADAAKLPWLLRFGGRERGEWSFERDGEITEVHVEGRVFSNTFSARIEVAKQGGHLIAVPNFVPDSFLEPTLQRILPDYRIVPRYPIYAVYPDARFMSPKVAEFLQLLKARHP